MALAITLLHTGSAQIFFSTVARLSITPNRLQNERDLHSCCQGM
jgi:hypothetical protein